MTTDTDNRFLDRVRHALGVSTNDPRPFRRLFPNPPKEAVQRVLNRIADRSAEKQLKLLEQLIEAGEPVNLKVYVKKDVHAVAAAIVKLVKKKRPEWGQTKQVSVWKHPLIDRLKLPDVLAPFDIPVHSTAFTGTETEAAGRDRVRKQVIDAFIGVTTADYCVAASATLVLKTRPGHARAVSLVPAIHIAVIEIDQIIADLKELYTLLKQAPRYKEEGITNCLTFISGPSKTADIEAVMVHGAHGPRELHLFVITGQKPQPPS